MKKELQTLLKRSIVMLLVLALAIPPVPVRAEGVIGGTSDGIDWTFDEATGTLTISPADIETDRGVMPDYTATTDVPWTSYIKKITTLEVKSGVTVLGNRTCQNAEKLTTVILPDTLTTIGERCFSDCYALEEITLPNSLTTIEQVAFNMCTSLKTIDLSHTGITELPYKAFAACSALTSITLPELSSDEGVIAIGDNCFGSTGTTKTSSLVRINYMGTGASWTALNITTTGKGSQNQQLLKCTLYCSDGVYKVDNYDAGAYSGNAVAGVPLTWAVADGTLTLTGWGAMPDFEENAAPWGKDFTSVVIDKYITSIGANAFYGCADLTESYTYAGNFDTLKAASSQTGNDALFGTPIPPEPEEPAEAVSGGIAWTFDETTGTLTISPAKNPEEDYESGVMRTNYTVKNPKEGEEITVPWYDYIPEDIKSLVVKQGVTVLGNRICNGAKKLASISLPDGLTEIGDRAFSNCESLTELNLPDTVTTLGATVFNGCTGLTEVDISNTGITELKEKAFAACSSLTSIKLPNNLTAIGPMCFGASSGAYTNKLKDIHFNGTGSDWTTNMTVSTGTNGDKNQTCNTQLLECTLHCTDGDFKIDENYHAIPIPTEPEEPTEAVSGGIAWTFDETTGTLTISPATNPESSYESGVMRTDYKNQEDGGVPWYKYRADITSMVVTRGVTTLGNRVCQDAKNLTSVSLQDGLKKIGERAFSDCYALEEIELPDSLEELGAVVFNGCVKLTSVDLSKTKIKNLARKAFAACPELVWVSIPATVTSIDDECFGDTKLANLDNKNHATGKLETLYFDGTIADWCSKVVPSFSADGAAATNLSNGKCTVYCLNGIWNANYISADNLCYKISNGTLSIRSVGAMPDYVEGAAPWFADAASITAVDFEDGITAIGANAFDGFVNLKTVNICQSVASVGENAFKDCVNLSDVGYLGTAARWETLKENTAAGNEPLLGATMTSGYSGQCGDNATWSYDPETKTLTISGTGPMWDYDQGTYQNVPWSKFSAELEKIVIGYGITATGRYAFCYLDALKELEFETRDGRTTCEVIGGYGFCWNNTLETLVLPEGVRFLSGRAFSRVESIKTVYLPSTLESVDMYAFKSEDASITVSNVYYNGTKEDFERKVYVSSQGDNDKYLLPDSDTTWHYQKSYVYYDDVPANSGAWYHDAVYYLKDQGMIPASGSFGVESPATLQWVLNTLYVRAGSSGAYADALDWAKVMRIAATDASKDQDVSLDALAEILYRTALYNGHSIDLGEGTVLAWCDAQGYISENVSANGALNRAQAASVLAAFLADKFGSADRYDQMRDQFKAAYQAGGDGKMYILALHHAGKGKVGDSTLILMPGGELMLIDTFRSDGWAKYLSATLEYLEVKDLDYLVLSHGHEDHDYNLSNVVNYIYDAGYTVGNYWSAGDTTSSRETSAIKLLEDKGGVTIEKKLRAGEQRIIGEGANRVVADILWPTAAGSTGDSNNGSLTMKLTYGDSSFITGGDLFMDGELAIVNLYKDDPQALRADVMKTNHHGSYSSDRFEWVHAVDPKVMFTHTDDTGDSAQCYQYSQEGRVWTSAGRDGGVLIVMDDEENISVTTGKDTNMRQYVVSPCANGHDFSGQGWESDETGHWRKCKNYYLCNAVEEVQEHNPVHSADGNVITVSCDICKAVISTTTLDEDTTLELGSNTLTGNIELPLGITLTTDQDLKDQIVVSEDDHLIAKETDGVYSYTILDTKITASNVELGNDLALNFWVWKNELKEDSVYSAKLTRSYADGRESTVTTIPMEQWIEKDTYYQIPYEGLSAKEMNDTIKIEILSSNKSVSNVFPDSIVAYAKYQLENYTGEDAAELKTALVDMLNYGAAAQKEFGYNENSLANAGIENYQHLATKDIPKLDDVWKGNGIGYGSNLELKENIILHIWFKNAGVKSVKIAYTDHYEKESSYKEFIVNMDDERISQRLAGISSVAVDTLVVADGAQVITCTFYGQEDAQGEPIGQVQESVESYLSYMMAKNTKSDPLYDAIAKFIDSSYNYFH